MLCSVDQIALLSSLGTSLVALVVPISIGMFVNHKWPQKAKMILKVSGPCYRMQSQMLHSVSWNDSSFQLLHWFSHYSINPILEVGWGWALKLLDMQLTLLERLSLLYPQGKFLSTLWDTQFKHHLLFYSTLYSHSTLFLSLLCGFVL